MAIFKDSNDNLYLGILYAKNSQLYSGNFIQLSKKAYQRILSTNRILSIFIKFTLALILMLSIAKATLSLENYLDWIFLGIGAGICAISIFYFAIGSIVLSRKKLYLSKKSLECLPTESKNIYSLLFLCTLSLFLDLTLSGFLNIMNTGLLLFFTLIPLIFASAGGFIYYAKKN
jgi:hypothetical protein